MEARIRQSAGGGCGVKIDEAVIEAKEAAEALRSMAEQVVSPSSMRDRLNRQAEAIETLVMYRSSDDSAKVAVPDMGRMGRMGPIS